MYIEHGISCCAIHEIVSLGDHTNPTNAMKAFCSNLWGRGRYTYGGVDRNLLAEPHSFYLFSGVERYKVSEEDDDDDYRPEAIKYASAFAKFIKENKLGRVRSSVGRYNRNHPTHWVKAYIWAPDGKNLREWYRKILNPAT